jgi:glucose-1-phosphate cytidylyltransferase
MKVVLLAGGFGTRLSEHTSIIPKPMVQIGDEPILLHIMNRYAKYGYKDFILALGYKADVIKDYFLNFHSLNNDFQINLKSGEIKLHNNFSKDWTVTLINTGLNTMTGGRLKRLKDYIGNERFMITYGDGVSDVNINDLLKFHKSHGRLVTMTSVRPSARFGELSIENNKVLDFKEKPQFHNGWINGGYFIMEPDIFDYIKDDTTLLEREPLENLAKDGQLMAFQHEGFWQCMDSKRDLELLQQLWLSGKAPWI